MTLINKWKIHLQENKMTYLQHLSFAVIHGFLCIVAGILLVFHGLLPCFFLTAGSDLVTLLSKRFKKRNQKDDT